MLVSNSDESEGYQLRPHAATQGANRAPAMTVPSLDIAVPAS